MVFQGGSMVFHGFWLVSMVFQGGFMVFYGVDDDVHYDNGGDDE